MSTDALHDITFWYDPISPYAHLAFERLPAALMGLSVQVRYRPLLFAALLKAHGQRGPAEIPSKRDWTYRQVGWLAQQHGVRLDLPAAHPFNPLPLLRLGLACATEDAPDDLVFDRLQETAFPDQPIGRSILGTPETVRSFSAKSLRTYSVPIDLGRFAADTWVTNAEDCWEVGAALCDFRHFRLITPAQARALAPRDATELRADDLVQYESADRKRARRY